MRPTITEQLVGMARTLERAVAPTVDDPYAAEQLGHIIVALRHVADGWATMLPRVLIDNAELVELLRRGDPFHRASTDLSPPRVDVPPFDESLAHNEALRAELDDLIRALADAPPSTERDSLRADVRSHLRASVARFTQ